MTAEQAIELLDRAVAMMQLNRQDHVNLLEAIKVLTEAIADAD